TEGGVVSGGVKLTLLSVLVEAVLRLPAASCATPAEIEAITVPAVVMPLTAKIGRAACRESVSVSVAPAVLVKVTPAPVKPLTGLLKTALKLVGALVVGLAWTAAWLSFTEGGVVSGGVKLTLLSVLVEAVFRLPAASCATPAEIEAITVPAVVMPLTATL